MGDEQQRWRKSSYSADTFNCLEIAEHRGQILVRDSKDPFGPVLAFGSPDWRSFVAAVRAGQLDRG